MYLADTLSRAYLLQQQTPAKADQKVERVHSVNFLSVSEPQIQEIRGETAKDPVLQSFKAVSLSGWPSSHESLPSELQPYFNIREELATQDDVIFKASKCVIPGSLRSKIKEKIHYSHIGIQGCLRRVREVVYWPKMNAELADFISRCEICNAFQSAQIKEPFICQEVPHRPREKVGCNLFTFNNSDYLCTVDYYSDYFEIDSEFTAFASSYMFEHVTSSAKWKTLLKHLIISLRKPPVPNQISNFPYSTGLTHRPKI